jgi:hypothetical protein
MLIFICLIRHNYLAMKHNEVWQFVYGVKGYYQISSMGNIRKLSKWMKNYGIQVYSDVKFENVKSEFLDRKILNTNVKIPAVRLMFDNDKPSLWPISVLMMNTFMGVLNVSSSEIIHLDGNEQNNNMSNLLLSNFALKNQYYYY